MRDTSTPSHRAFCAIEALEQRQLLAVNWGAYPKLIDQDLAVRDFPNITGKGVNVAIIDSGWDFSHPKLEGKLWINPGETAGDGIDNDRDGHIDNTTAWDYMRGDNHPDDENSHGTQMGGIIAGKLFTGLDGFEYQGLAPDAKIIPLKTIDGHGTIYTLSFAQRVERALRWIEGNHKRYNISIVSMSIGVHKADFEATFADEVKRLNEAGVLLIASAGHFGRDKPLEYPAADPNVYSAGVVNEEDKIGKEQQRGPQLDILGPGSKIQILHKGSSYLVSGEASSYPTPFIAGAAALIKQINPEWKPKQIMDILIDSGKKVSDGEDEYPRLDIDNAIRLAIRRNGGDPGPDPDQPPPATQQPFKGSPFNITSRIEAEDFDKGPAFKNSSRKMRKGYRKTPVELARTNDGRGYHVTSIRRGEWLEYTVNVPSAGLYTFEGRFQPAGRGAAFHIELDGTDVSGKIGIPDSGKKAKWRTISKSDINLPAGQHVIRIAFDSATSKKIAGNFNWFRFTAN